MRSIVWWRAAVASAVLVLSLAPIARWVGEVLTPSLDYTVDGWWSGTAIVGLLTALVMVVIRRFDLGDPLRRAGALLTRWWDERPVRAIASVTLAAVALYVFDAWWIFSGRPLLIDEVVQVIQARIFASGRLWWPVEQYPEFRSIMHLVEQDGRLYGQFPPGGPAMLALGELMRAPWLVNPVFGGVSVAALALTLRWARVGAALALGTTVLFAFAPFVVFQSASHMNHVTSLSFLLIATAALVRATHATGDRPLAGLVCGLGLGIAATIRPLDAAAWALPAACWLAAQAVRDRRWGAFIASGIGVAAPMLVMMWVNVHTTGGALTFGYDVMWGKGVGLGFHTPPWGEPHTIRRGLAITAAYLNRLNDHFFETPVPVLVPVAFVIAWSRTSSRIERYWLVTAAAVLAAYFAYWHDGYYPGPRFMFTLSPVIALLVARVPGVIADRLPGIPQARAATLAAFVAAGLAGIVFVLPIRVAQYRALFTSMRIDYPALAAAAGARTSGDVVLIRESWGSQVLLRLWARGIPRTQAEFLYRRIDTCQLDSALVALESTDVRGDAAFAVLRPLLADSARVEQSRLSRDESERVLPGATYSFTCQARLLEDRGGFGHFAPLWLVRETPVRFVRDLHGRDTLVVGRTDRVWLFRVEREEDAPVRPVLERLNTDSLHAAWGWSPR